MTKEVKESAEYDNFLDRVQKPKEEASLTGFIEEVDEPSAIDADEWEKHWFDMPECKSSDLKMYKRLIVNFRCAEDYEEFRRVTGLSLTMKTKTTYFPMTAKNDFTLTKWVQDDE